jgi:hypothetical protein
MFVTSNLFAVGVPEAIASGDEATLLSPNRKSNAGNVVLLSMII